MIERKYKFDIPLPEAVSVQSSIQRRIDAIQNEAGQNISPKIEATILELETLWKDIDAHIAQLAREKLTERTIP